VILESKFLSVSVNQNSYQFTGNDAASGKSSGPAVFDTATGFVANWHLNEQEQDTGTAGVYKDATDNMNHGTDYLSSPAQTGVIYSGQSFDGAADYIAVPHHASHVLSDQVTLCGWIHANSFGSWSGIITKGTTRVSYALEILGTGAIKFTANWRTSADDSTQSWNSSQVLQPGVWSHIAAVYDGSRDLLRFYINGEADSREISVDLTFDVVPELLSIGCDIPGNVEYFNGAMDELSIADAARSGAWLKLSYENQKLNSNVVIIE
jgi:hypothetical protein